MLPAVCAFAAVCALVVMPSEPPQNAPTPVTPKPAPAPAVAPTSTTYPEPTPLSGAAILPDAPYTPGRGVQRTMSLLVQSTPTHRNHVKILVYGQSISEQDWWKQVADDLRRRFPNADLDIQNKAIGGFASQLLIRPAEHDVYPWYPDLVIFHVYGANQEYEQITHNIRSRTTAEVLIQRDHVTKWPAPTDQLAPDKDKGAWWDDFMNNHVLPDTARKYGCGIVDIRGQWLDYLRTNHVEPKALLSDDVHLNAWGNFLMARLISRYLVYRPELADTVDKNSVQTLVIGRDIRWRNGRLTVPFTGNRVDLVMDTPVKPTSDGKDSHIEILVDGKKPSAFAEAYSFTRPQPNPWSPLALVRVDKGTNNTAPFVSSQTPDAPETWTLTITDVSPDFKTWDYTLSNALTGADGAGSNRAPFTSPSGRVGIAPEAFFHPNDKPIFKGYTITWQTQRNFADHFVSPPQRTIASMEQTLTAIQGIANAPHTLELIGVPFPTLRAVRVYCPPVK